MAARNGPAGYGWVSKSLHWVTVLVVATQFVVGYAMDVDDGGRGRGRGGDSGRGRGRGGEDAAYLDTPETLLLVHVGLGLTVLVLVVVRVAWRRRAGLPPWSEHLSADQRRLAHWTERALLSLLVVVPVSGLVLVLAGDDDVLPLHIGAHVAFFATLAAHLFLNLRPRILRRML